MSSVILGLYLFSAQPSIKPLIKVPEERWHIRVPYCQAAVRVVIIRGYYYYESFENGKPRYSPMYDSRGKMVPVSHEHKNIFKN